MPHPHPETYSHTTLDEFRVGFDYQTEWAQGRGLLMLAAVWIGGLGGGLFLTSLIIGWRLGVIISLVIVAVGKGGFHLGFLGHPERFWRAFVKPQTSWLSRGIIILTLFIIFGALYVVQPIGLWMILGGLFAVGLVTYTGFLLAASPSIRFWNNALLPIIFLTAAIWSGASLAELIQPAQVESYRDFLYIFQLVVGGLTVWMLFTYMVVSYMSTIGAKEAVSFLAGGSMAPVFYGLAVVLGLIIPIAILVIAFLGNASSTLLAVAGIAELVGSFFLRLSILKAGVYEPIL
jgi:formate-dependent nitrite reductase membrane component NrfD